MADNLEVRVEQLTSAIRGLYDKPTATINDINNAINAVMQRFDNTSSTTNEQLGQALVADVRRVMEEKHNYVQDHLSSFESMLRQIASNSTDQKLSNELSRLTAELSTVYTKMANQETLLNSIARSIDSAGGSADEIEKLRGEISTFSRGFENITQSLNKNFNDFLIQVQSYSGKDDFKRLFVDLDSISNNTNAIISALAIIDHKYKDLTGLIDLVSKKENTFSQGLDELSRSVKSVDELSGMVRNTSTKEDVSYLNDRIGNLKTYIESIDTEGKARVSEFIYTIESKLNALQNSNDFDRLKDEIRVLYNELKDNSNHIKEDVLAQIRETVNTLSSSNNTFKEDFNNQSSVLNKNLQFLSEEILKLHGYVSENVDLKTEEIRSDIKSFISDFSQLKTALESSSNSDNLRENIERINDENFVKMYDLIHEQLVNLDSSIELRTTSNRLEISGAISNLQGEVKSIVTNLMNLKNEFGDVSRQNIDILKAPIEKALSNIENLTIGNELKQLHSAVDGIMADIKKSFEQLKDNFSEIATSSNIQVLQQLNSSIPSIADRLEVFRTHVMSENSAHIKELKQHFNEAIEAVKANVENVTTTLKADFGNISGDISQTIKIDMQKLSDHIVENVESVNLSISQEFNDHKVNIDELLVRIQDYENKFKEKFDSIEATFESLNTETCERMTEAINTNSRQYQDAINSVKKDIITHVSGMGEQSRSALAELSLKLDQMIETSSIGALTSIGSDEKSVAYANIETKLERANLQQIHNAKELMEEIQNINSELSFKIENMLESDDTGNVSRFMAKLEDKIQTLLDNGRDIDQLAKSTKEHIDTRMKEILQKISKANAIHSVKSDKKSDSYDDDEISANSKVQELVSGLEFLQKNLFEEMREAFEKQNEILNNININDANNAIDVKVPEINTDEIVKKLKDCIKLDHIVEEIRNVSNADEIAKKLQGCINFDDIINEIRNIPDADEIAKKLQGCINFDDIINEIRNIPDTDEIVKKLQGCIKLDHIVEEIRNVSNADEIAKKLQGCINFDDIINEIRNIPDADEIAGKLKDCIKLDHIIGEIRNVSNADEIVKKLQDCINFDHIIEEIKNVSSADEIAKKVKDELDIEGLIKKIKDPMDIEELAKEIKNCINMEDLAVKMKESFNVDEIAIKIKDYLDIEEFLKKVSDPIDADEIAKRVKDCIDTDDIVRRVREAVASVESKVENSLEGKVCSIEKHIKDLGETISKLQKDTSESTYTYTMEDVESDIAKVRLSVEKSSTRVSETVDAQKNALDDIRGRLAAIQKTGSTPPLDDSRVDDISHQISKRLNVQEARFNGIEDKLCAIIQKQNEEFDIKAFIDVFYENTTQTKSLASRVETMEGQLSVIARHMQKIISYIEE